MGFRAEISIIDVFSCLNYPDNTRTIYKVYGYAPYYGRSALQSTRGSGLLWPNHSGNVRPLFGIYHTM